LETLSEEPLQTLIALPKIDLHRHLEGSLRLSTLAELVHSESMDLPGDESVLQKMVQISPGEPHTSDIFLTKFKSLRNFYRSPEIIQRFVREAVLDAASDNIRHLELIFTPYALAQERGFPLREVVDWVVESARKTAEEEEISVGLIASFNRHESMEIAEEVARIAVDQMENGIVGLSLAGNEVEFSAEPFAGLFHDAREAGLRISIHAGEWTGAETVRHALETLEADRIGHGIRIMEDEDVVAIARERRTTFEVCLSSNLHSGVIERMEDHPLLAMIQAGLQVTLNTDDPAISNIRLSEEFLIAIEQLGLSITTIKALILVAAQAAFLSPHKRKALEESMQAGLYPTGS
jgi:adenosine deaminase